MKKLFFTTLLITFVAIVFGQSSVYHPFPTSNAYWREVSAGFQCYCCAKYQYVLAGDTAINSVTYHKLIHSGKQYSSNQAGDCEFSEGSIPFSYYNGALRNDIPGKKIWFIPSNSTQEELLYDFDLKLHDSLQPTYINNISGPNIYIIVSTVDSALVGNVYYKSFGIAFSSSPNGIFTHIIEGVGSTYGLFGSMGELKPPFEFGSMLECFSIDGISVYPAIAQECALYNGVIPTFPLEKCSISPNPFNETAVLNIPDQFQQVDIQLFDESGRVVFFQNGVKNGSVFNRSNLSNGIYFYKFSQNLNVLSYGKLIIN